MSYWTNKLDYYKDNGLSVSQLDQVYFGYVLDHLEDSEIEFYAHKEYSIWLMASIRYGFSLSLKQEQMQPYILNYPHSDKSEDYENLRKIFEQIANKEPEINILNFILEL